MSYMDFLPKTANLQVGDTRNIHNLVCHDIQSKVSLLPTPTPLNPSYPVKSTEVRPPFLGGPWICDPLRRGFCPVFPWSQWDTDRTGEGLGEVITRFFPRLSRWPRTSPFHRIRHIEPSPNHSRRCIHWKLDTTFPPKVPPQDHLSWDHTTGGLFPSSYLSNVSTGNVETARMVRILEQMRRASSQMSEVVE